MIAYRNGLDVRIPRELARWHRPQWVCWRLEDRNGKKTKVPIDPHTGLWASTADPVTWTDFKWALRAVGRYRCNGVGFVFTAEDPFVGIDLDHSRDSETGRISERAQQIIQSFNSYTEVSPSGSGLHCLVRGSLPAGRRRLNGIEVYDSGRFFTITFAHLKTSPTTVAERQAELNCLVASITAPRTTFGTIAGEKISTESDDEILTRARSAKNGDKFDKLFSGDFRDYQSQSEADLALCSILAFWTGNDSASIDRLFRRSRLMREKWERQDYRLRTIMAAVSGVTDSPVIGDARTIETPPVTPDNPTPGNNAPTGSGGEPQPYVCVTPEQSFISRYVKYASQRTDAPAEAHELMAVGILSALAGPTPRLPMATSVNGWSLCLWVLYIVDSTSGRKTSVINYAIDIAREVLGEEAILSWEGSPQGILQRLQSRDGQSAIFARDEYSGLLGQMNRSGGHMAGLAQMFIRAYDGGSLENIRTKKRNRHGQLEDDSDRVARPYLVKLCASTRESFVTRATIDNVLDGFLARFLVFTGVADPQPIRRSTPELDSARLSLIDHGRRFHDTARQLQEVDLDDMVLDLAWALERDWLKKANDCSRPDAAAPALKRLSESVLKVAALLAIDESWSDRRPRVVAEHFEQARLMGTRWIESALSLIDSLGRTTFQKHCENVLATVRAHPQGVRTRDVYRKHRKLTNREFNDVLNALETQDEIEIHDGENKKGPAFKFVIPTGRG